jgi:hypothetical protein
MSEARRLTGAGDEPFTFFVDGEPLVAHPGETVAVALLAAGRRALRASTRRGEPRGLYCAMGVCWECAVRVEGSSVRACVAPAAPGLRVETPGRAAASSGTAPDRAGG